MADKKAAASPPKAPKVTASATDAAAAPAKKPAAAKPRATAAKTGTASETVSKRGTCTAEKCTRALRAKGYCRKHFLAWRRGTLGAHHHYKICSKEACRKQREFGGLCAEHAGKVVAEPAAGAAS
jgi:hypothetical protein